MNERASKTPAAETRASERGAIDPTTAERPQGRPTPPDALLPAEQMSVMRERWDEIQTSFVDDPRSAVSRAEELVDGVVDALTNTFARERSRLEGQWNTGEKVETEQLRIALQRYRTFFNRLLGPET